MQQTIMTIGAHADDVEICFAGTLFKYRDNGYSVVYVQSTNNMAGSKRRGQPDGTLKCTSYGTVETMAYRKAECDKAAMLFGTIPVHLDHPQRHYSRGGSAGQGGGPTDELRYGSALPEGVTPDIPTILTAHEDTTSVTRVTELIFKHDPEVVFSHGLAEVDPEHSTTALLVVKGYWAAVREGYRGSLLLTVNPGLAELGTLCRRWETWVDISGFEDRKLAAIQTHASQFPPDFEEGARYYREVMANFGAPCGVDAAELFNFINPASLEPPIGTLLAELHRHRGFWG